MKKVTEQESNYQNLEQMPLHQLLTSINNEDQLVAKAVRKAIPQLEALVANIVVRMKAGGRLFYIGAGTSGRLGIIDASECPPTYGVDFDCVIGLIAGGDEAIRKAVENAEDKIDGAWTDLLAHQIKPQDCVIGIAASGTTPYVLGGLLKANELGCITGCIVCNLESPIAKVANYPVEVVTGPEFVTGSTRMKAGTATKMVLNMLSTSVMIQLGKVKGNKMINMKLANNKLVQRGIEMLMAETQVNAAEAAQLLTKFGSVKTAIAHIHTQLK